ncbi:hypothetical protein M378DRAFT_156227 [Amanita muscaria Koide BX008]|uniref:Uncharacterized protein n=1 Tax=Amanita muscaria (strain Koide BX008) TaxID=946122 RepID=A0A0C2XKX1_AMAMK|nr:hypothetical protein M378DRAFT_156227 [Amanita muscaria Koide BX008]
MCRPLTAPVDHVCPMCKVFPHSRCQHQSAVCRNRKYHPSFDVQYLTNAEVDWFNGCGYCKVARAESNSKPGSNPGWPGCCRPPVHSEYASIPIYVWRAVNIVHHVQIPPEIKAMLEIPKLPTPAGSLRGPRKPAATASERKGTGNSSPTTKSTALPGKPRLGGSPQQPTATLTRSAGAVVVAPATAEQRRPSFLENGDKSSHSNPSRMKLPDFEASATPRRSTSVRQATPPATTTSTDNRVHGSVRRSNTVTAAQPTHSRSSSTSTLSRVTLPNARPVKERDDELSSASSSGGSSDGTESLSDNTVVSDGAFTDYLSDESEAELQRQAEARAALLAQTQMEEMEFKAARLQLAHVDLRPPKSWRGGK